MFCAAPNCDKDIVYNSGYCNSHYQMLRLYGRVETVCWGQSNHPLYNMWNEKKNKGLLCDEWIDFISFIKGIGECPSEDHCLRRINQKEKYSPDNFKWIFYYRRKDGESHNQQQIRRRKENPEIYKSYELKKSFKIDYAAYRTILEKQNFVCAICEEPEKTIHHVTNELKSLAVDHCHETGKIRGLLCQRCNRVLGKIKDRIDLLDKMKDYLNAS